MQGHDYLSEAFRMNALALDLANAQLRNVDAFWPTVAKDDPSREVRLDGLRRMRLGFMQVAVGTLISLNEPQDRRIVLGRMELSLPALYFAFDDPARAKIDGLLNAISKNAVHKQDVANLKATLDAYDSPLPILDELDKNEPIVPELPKAVTVTQHAVANTGEWKRYTSSSGLFSAELPNQPKDFTARA